ncbi:hypothetical protein JQC92_20310 [Shewanella sp. 202IG2-18]|uniref:hypothetical protein n=1 Tax=Parashewanella hymeniacidonis TaxID=2807618 RepID=UPI0019606118|nr:hypothetical protein [Parashewanella hymeniacidonis]MBM7074337.1 hypothetical protein [Parashewanella hymeniacidonis]
MIKTNARDDGKGLTSYWVRDDPDKYSIKEDKNGFILPCTPSHSLRILNNYMRTDILRLVHMQVHEYKNLQPEQSPLTYLIKSINDVIHTVVEEGNLELIELTQNPFHHHPTFEFESSTDAEHDIKLMKFHLNALQKIQKELDEDEFS